jgi:sugar O-acyltransferase (sialic acid O-acetyltransferase NeuD family)
MVTQVGIYGAGGFGREVVWLVRSCNQKRTRYETVCFIDDDPHLHGKQLNGISVLGLDEAGNKYPALQLVRGIGAVRASMAAVEKAESAGLTFLTVIHPGTECSEHVSIGDGTVICAGNILTTNIIVGNYVQINIGCTIGHDVVLGDYTTIAPGVHVSGYVHVGKGVYIGTGAVIVNGTEEKPLVIGDDVIIGAGACVTKSIPRDTTVVGIPARPMLKT